jgi:uncharacterized protein (UPF0548 family)
MLQAFRVSQGQMDKLLAAVRGAPPSSPHLLTVADGSLGTPPKGFAHDLSRSEIGRGRHDFVAAREALQQWEQLDLGWVRVANPIAKIAPGELLAVEAHTSFLWSISFNRVTDVLDDPTRFGIMYTTTAFHIEEGQERFIIDFDSESESVSYLIEAVSRPRHLLARVGYPLSRAMQRRFARDSHARMKRAVLKRQ